MSQAPKQLLRAQKIANLLDTHVKLPIVGIPVGLDFLIGLLPIVGDGIMFLLSMYIVWLGRSMGMPSGHLKAMTRHNVIDLGLSLLPFVGDVIDIFYKAGRANVKIMETWWLEQNRGALSIETQAKLDKWLSVQEK